MVLLWFCVTISDDTLSIPRASQVTPDIYALSFKTVPPPLAENPNKVGEPKLQKPIGAELGCVTPYVIVGGDWTQEELEYHAKQVVSGATQNAGHNCLTTEIVMTCKDWPQREAFMNALRKVLAETPNR